MIMKIRLLNLWLTTHNWHPSIQYLMVQILVHVISWLWILFHLVVLILVLLGVHKLFFLKINNVLESVCEFVPSRFRVETCAIEHDLHVSDLLDDVNHIHVAFESGLKSVVKFVGLRQFLAAAFAATEAPEAGPEVVELFATFQADHLVGLDFLEDLWGQLPLKLRSVRLLSLLNGLCRFHFFKGLLFY
jgi:hypothetical protein